jgi:multidrug efflux pump subunit AcrB
MASEGGARRMLAPVLASSLTTIAAFLPLMLIGGRMGSIMLAIPMVIVCVIIASLIESFLILPGHLRHAFVHDRGVKHSRFKQRLDRGFEQLRERWFRRLVRVAIEFRWTTIACAIGFLLSFSRHPNRLRFTQTCALSRAPREKWSKNSSTRSKLSCVTPSTISTKPWFQPITGSTRRR